MDRRRMLAIIIHAGAAGLAGCVRAETRLQPSPDVTTPTAESKLSIESPPTPTKTRVPDGVQRRVSIVEQDSADEYDLRIEIDLLEDTITHEQPAHLQLRVANEGSKRLLSVRNGDMCHLFNRDRGHSDDPDGLFIGPKEFMDEIPREGDKWVPATPFGYLGYACSPSSWETGESSSMDYTLWAFPQVEYFVPATYRWEEEIKSWSDLDAEKHDPADETFTWGFSLKIEP